MNYVNSIKSPATRKIYTTLLRQFLEFCNLRETEELLTRLGDPRQIESRIIGAKTFQLKHQNQHHYHQLQQKNHKYFHFTQTKIL